MLVQCWASVVDGGPTLGRCLVSAGTSMLFSIQPMTGGQERGGLWGGGGGTCMCIRAHQSYTDAMIAKPTQYDTGGMTLATGILANLPAG